MNLTTRDWLTIIGGACSAIGLVFMHHVDSVPIYITGEVLSALGPVLIGGSRFAKQGDQPPKV